MAIIPRYTSRALPPGAQPGLITGAQSRGEAGAGLARAFGGAVVEGIDYKARRDLAAKTAAAAKLAERTAAEKRRAENLDHRNGETMLAAAEAEITKGRARAVASAKTGGVPARDMARISLADFDDTTRKQAEALKTRPHLKARFDAMVESSRAPHELRMLTLENERRAGEEKAVLAAALGELAQAAVDDPAMAPGVTGRGLAQIESAMEAAMLDAEEAAAMQGEFAENVHMSAMRGQIAIDPALALEKLESGEFDDIFDPPARDQLLGEARTTARVKQAGVSAAARAKRRGLEIDMEEHLAVLDKTGAGDEAVDARAQAELPEIEYAAFKQGQAQSRERHATRAEYAFMTPTEIEADIAQQAPGGGPRDSDERDAAHSIRTAIRDEVLTARATDPAGWALRDDEVAAAFAAAAENRHDPVSARRAQAMRLALQREMGIAQTRLLSEAERDDIAERLADAGPRERRAELHRLWKGHGEGYGRLVQELGGEIDAETALLAQYAMHPRLAELLAKGMEKAKANGPAQAKGDVPLLPAAIRPGKTANPGAKGRMRKFHQYVMPGGERVEYDGEALVPVAAAEMASTQSLPGGATLWPGARSQPTPADWAGVGKSIAKAVPRAGAIAGVAAAASYLVTPWNAQEVYHSFGEGGAMRLRTAPGDLLGSVERLDPDTGEWVATELVGFIMGAEAGNLPSIVAGTPEQVERAGRAEPMAVPDGQLPPPPGLVPPVVPDLGEETFPAEESGPITHVTPEVETGGDTEAFPIPEQPRAQADIFLALSDEIIREIMKPLEAHRGDEHTRRGNDIVVQKVYEQLERWFPGVSVKTTFDHVAGATRYGAGKEELKEEIVRHPETRQYSIPDVKIWDTEKGGWIGFNTGKVLKDGSTLNADERRQLERLRENLGGTGIAEGLPKLRPGIDEAEYAARVERRLEEIFTEYFGRVPGS